MAKRARATVSAAGTSNAERFVSKLGKTLSKRYNLSADVKVEQVVTAFRTAVSALPTGSKLQEALQANFDVYTKLLHAQLSNQLQLLDPAVPAKRVKHSAQPDVPVTPQPLTDRSVSSTEAQADQCLQLLADTAQLQTTSDTPQLQRALDTIKLLLQSTVTKHGMPIVPATVQLLQPVIARLMTVCLLQNRHAQAPHRQGHRQQLDHHLLAQAVAMAAEFQQMLSNKVLNHCVVLAAHNIKVVVLELLLASHWTCCWSAQSQKAKALWRTLYKAALQHMPTGISAVEYLLIVTASQKASRVYFDADFEVAATVASIPAPLSLMTWLQQMPASTVAKQCQPFAKKGPLAVTNHLLHSVDEETLAALRQCLIASSKPTAEEDSVQAPDGMLFYVDDAGESAFGKGWVSDDEPQSEADGMHILQDLSETVMVQSSGDSE